MRALMDPAFARQQRATQECELERLSRGGWHEAEGFFPEGAAERTELSGTLLDRRRQEYSFVRPCIRRWNPRVFLSSTGVVKPASYFREPWHGGVTIRWPAGAKPRLEMGWYVYPRYPNWVRMVPSGRDVDTNSTFGLTQAWRGIRRSFIGDGRDRWPLRHGSSSGSGQPMRDDAGPLAFTPVLERASPREQPVDEETRRREKTERLNREAAEHLNSRGVKLPHSLDKNVRLSDALSIAEELRRTSNYDLAWSVVEAEAMERIYGEDWMLAHLRVTWSHTTWDPCLECVPYLAEDILKNPEKFIVERVPVGSVVILGHTATHFGLVWRKLIEPWIAARTEVRDYGKFVPPPGVRCYRPFWDGDPKHNVRFLRMAGVERLASWSVDHPPLLLYDATQDRFRKARAMWDEETGSYGKFQFEVEAEEGLQDSEPGSLRAPRRGAPAGAHHSRRVKRPRRERGSSQSSSNGYIEASELGTQLEPVQVDGQGEERRQEILQEYENVFNTGVSRVAQTVGEFCLTSSARDDGVFRGMDSLSSPSVPTLTLERRGALRVVDRERIEEFTDELRDRLDRSIRSDRTGRDFQDELMRTAMVLIAAASATGIQGCSGGVEAGGQLFWIFGTVAICYLGARLHDLTNKAFSRLEDLGEAAASQVIEVQQATGRATAIATSGLIYLAAIGIALYFGYLAYSSHLIWKTKMRLSGMEPEANVEPGAELDAKMLFLQRLSRVNVESQLHRTLGPHPTTDRLKLQGAKVASLVGQVKLVCFRTNPDGEQDLVAVFHVPSSRRNSNAAKEENRKQDYVVELDMGKPPMDCQQACSCGWYIQRGGWCIHGLSCLSACRMLDASSGSQGLSSLAAYRGGEATSGPHLKASPKDSRVALREDGRVVLRAVDRATIPAPPPGLDRWDTGDAGVSGDSRGISGMAGSSGDTVVFSRPVGLEQSAEGQTAGNELVLDVSPKAKAIRKQQALMDQVRAGDPKGSNCFQGLGSLSMGYWSRCRLSGMGDQGAVREEARFPRGEGVVPDARALTPEFARESKPVSDFKMAIEAAHGSFAVEGDLRAEIKQLETELSDQKAELARKETALVKANERNKAIHKDLRRAREETRDKEEWIRDLQMQNVPPGSNVYFLADDAMSRQLVADLGFQRCLKVSLVCFSFDLHKVRQALVDAKGLGAVVRVLGDSSQAKSGTKDMLREMKTLRANGVDVKLGEGGEVLTAYQQHGKETRLGRGIKGKIHGKSALIEYAPEAIPFGGTRVVCLLGSSNWSVASSANCDFGVQVLNPEQEFVDRWYEQFNLHFARAKHPDIIDEERSRSPSRNRADRSLDPDLPGPEEVDDPEGEHGDGVRGASGERRPATTRSGSAVRRRLSTKTTPKWSTWGTKGHHAGPSDGKAEGDRDGRGSGVAKVTIVDDPG